MARQPLVEVFGYPVESNTPEAERHRRLRLCPFNNKVPNCTKDSVTDPLGVCTIRDGERNAVICPVRFRQEWHIAEHAARFFFPPEATWTSLVEVRLNDRSGKSAGNIDVVLVQYDTAGQVVDFGSLEVQAVYISGNLRKSFYQPFQQDRDGYLNFDWSKSRVKPPRPDYLSSSRKRLAPQLIYKGGIFHAWGRKQAVAVHLPFFEQMPPLPTVPEADAEMVWLIYDFVDNGKEPKDLQLVRTEYTAFKPSLDAMTLSEAGNVTDFISTLQGKLINLQGGASMAQIADTPLTVSEDAELADNLANL